MTDRDLDPMEEQELEEAKAKGSLLFQLWSDARAKSKEFQNQLRQMVAKEAEVPESTEPAGPAPADGTHAPEGGAPAVSVSDDIMPAENNYLQKLRAWPAASGPLPYVVLPTKEFVLESTTGAEPGAETQAGAEAAQAPAVPQPVLYSSFMADQAEPSLDQRAFLLRLQNDARKRLNDFSTLGPDGIPAPQDALCCVGLSKDNYSAFAFIFPPCNTGADITTDDIITALEKAGVKQGFKEDVISAAAEEKQYFLLFTAALGQPCINGQDGRIIDRFSRVKRIRLIEREDHTVDYKDLNWLQRVSEGDVISEIVLPTDPQDGYTVQGRAIAGRPGKRIIPPNGKNTVLSEDGTLITAAIDGQITFTGQRFNVEQLLIVGTDLGPETGNLDVVGNVVIKGNVMEGFSVRATGDITINGMAEGAIVMAGGNIQVGMGMNGNSRGVLNAKGDIMAKYLENCTAIAGACIHSENIINCTVCCDDSALVTSGRGVIIGGSITALNAIKANSVGNRSNRTTVLTLGSTPGFLTRKLELESAIKEIYMTQSEHTKNLSFLSRKLEIAPSQQQLEADIKVRLSALKLKLNVLEKEYKEMVEKQTDMTGCLIFAGKLYPPTQITFGTTSVMVRDTIDRCSVYYHEGEIRFNTRV